jgi:hypothetical protein
MKFVKSDKPVSTTHAKLGDISVDVEVPQAESSTEAIAFCGGEDGFLAFFNSCIETNAKNGGRAALRNLPEDANLDEARVKIQGIVKDYAPQAGGDRQPSVKKKAAAFDAVKAKIESGAEFTREELLAMLADAK